jgi:hypothetical protein
LILSFVEYLARWAGHLPSTVKLGWLLNVNRNIRSSRRKERISPQKTLKEITLLSNSFLSSVTYYWKMNYVCNICGSVDTGFILAMVE